eukprot:TRINITY_DN10228_c0_g1_i1.p1 TRINITY_DN10228_c0_g1~~TRINITY_DN10228_c0_g1_i1.p1  ORF type:complete len:325 (+),score=36.74 TRINITY_DN10228_c0_g1_i1:112-1086(+)
MTAMTSHLVCAKCGMPVASTQDLITSKKETAPALVYPYELALLGTDTWCYSASEPNGDRKDLVLVKLIPAERGAANRSALLGEAALYRGLGCTSLPWAECGWWTPGPALRRPAHCTGCLEPNWLGWLFTCQHVEFFGLLLTRLREQQVDLGCKQTGLGRKEFSMVLRAYSNLADRSGANLSQQDRQHLSTAAKAAELQRTGSSSSVAKIPLQALHSLQELLLEDPIALEEFQSSLRLSLRLPVQGGAAPLPHSTQAYASTSWPRGNLTRGQVQVQLRSPNTASLERLRASDISPNAPLEFLRRSATETLANSRRFGLLPPGRRR